eukprot:CAMPEP_0119121592 /NCGR_PEP_ID=MMETSP1310-20130426/2151_1 /TAXON_ID=464262 /ORGANISM="Genus nov. species nov., Strain RCC2339" /LENGTH=298 /DNA_ID=CAMNT_0007111163 /DNA_START=132 /DNA_END=1024 /DNA_ORIENTATION=-
METNLKNVLEGTVVNELLPERDIVLVTASESIHDVIKKMSREHILSVPVFFPNKGTIQGMFDLNDALSLVLNKLESGSSVDDVASLPVGDAMNLSKVDVFMPLSATLSLYHLVEWFTRGIHRVPVLNDEGTVEGIVSQSSVLRFIANHLDSIPESVLNRTVASHGLGGKGVTAVASKISAADAFRKLSADYMDAAPVVSEATNSIIGTFSVSALRGILLVDIETALSKNVEHFVMQKHTKPISEQVCKANETLRDILKRLAKSGGHRLWIVDDDLHPIGVITLTDLMRTFMKYFSGSR